MIKRMSILVRRPQDDRAIFSEYWQGIHGGLVRNLPGIRCYIQNHIQEDFKSPLEAPGVYAADGFVELYFDDDKTMVQAFSSEGAKALLTDEPNFLGHGTTYVIGGDHKPIDPITDAKLVLVAGSGEIGRSLPGLEALATALPDIRNCERNYVGTIIPKQTMAKGPQPVKAFLHLRFAEREAARQAARSIALSDEAMLRHEGLIFLGVHRVEERRVV